MKKRYKYFSLFLVLLVGILSACTTNVLPTPSTALTVTSTPTSLPEPLSTSTPFDEKIVETVLSFEISYLFDEKLEQEKLQDIVRAVFDDKKQRDSFVVAYLNEREMYKPMPDGTYGYGNYYAEYYTNEENRKTSFILHEDMSSYSVYCISFSWDDLSEIGSMVYEYDENQNIVFEGVYTTEELCAAYASYEYLDGIPFPFVNDFYIEYTEFVDGYIYDDIFHMNQRFWLDKKFAVIDETGKVNSYNADLYNWKNAYFGTIYNDFSYDKEGRLTAIYEEFSEDDGTDTKFWEFATDITIEYREDDTLSTVDYGFYYMDYDTHARGSGDSTGKIFYDEQGRMIYRTYYMTHGAHSCFYLYEVDSKIPWAYIEVGGLAQSGDDVSEYGFGVSVYLFQPLVNEMQNDHPLWQDAYAGFMRENMQTSYFDPNTSVKDSDAEARFMAFSAGGYPVTPFFYLHDIDKDGIPELIYIDAANGYDGDVYTYKNHSISKIDSIKFYPFGGLGIPLDKTEGLYSDLGYKGHYGEIYFYTVNSGILTGQAVLEYNNQLELSPSQSALPHSFDNFASLDYYEVTEANIIKVIYGGE